MTTTTAASAGGGGGERQSSSQETSPSKFPHKRQRKQRVQVQRDIVLKLVAEQSGICRRWRRGKSSQWERQVGLECVAGDPMKRFQANRINLTEKWRRGLMSNFEYIRQLNLLAGRSCNDIAQYPVFPWVIADYTSEKLDLTNPLTFRDLTKPMGAQDEERAQQSMQRYLSWPHDDTIPAFHYGSHYSSGTIVSHFLVRKEPFTEIARATQGHVFDLPDRLFDHLGMTYQLCSRAAVADVREVIPEFYTDPSFLVNEQNLDLGIKQDGERVGDVRLPPWAADPADFVRQNREALECEHVSAHLHSWIDLIFGYKQRGQAAVDAQNVFYYLTYADSVDLDSISDPKLRKATEDQIAHFGQTPAQLLTKPHPPRYSLAQREEMAMDPDWVEKYQADPQGSTREQLRKIGNSFGTVIRRVSGRKQSIGKM
eukprot:gb/GEZN01007626.1/.p1 GENE.gb/GEZN01007626.1/~~gb/GEZN01007626.1/.p1  ORF type:complete len:427 (-),score=58.17 gb/GEZN01007626.1/:119-1399(-)